MRYSLSSHKNFITVLLLLFFGRVNGQFINVDATSYTPQQLVADKFIGSQNLSCVSISNVTVSGGNLGAGNSSYGYFNKGTSNLGMNEGIILSTGNILAAPGPKTKPVQSATASGWTGDLDLADATGLPMSELSNATFLEFDFKSTLNKKISFRYMFLSEEYYPGNYKYSDAFAFLIKKKGSTDPYQNIAVVPGTGDPVSVTTINDRDNPKYFDGFIGFYSQQNGSNDSATNFNGQTKILTAVAEIDPGEDYHIKLVIADEGKNANSQYDSAVFLEAGSFTGNIDMIPAIETDDSAIICNGSNVTIQPKNPATDINDSGAKYYWYKDNVSLGLPLNQTSYTTNVPGDYRLEVVLSTGCTLAGNVKVENAPVAVINNSPIMICDDDFDGKYVEKLSNFTGQIVTNFNGDFTVEYYTQSGTKINPDNDFEFTQNPQDITVKVGAFSCTPDTYTLQFYHGSQLQMNYLQQPATIPVFDVCDNEFKGSKTVILDDYIGLMTTETLNPTDVKFYDKISDLKADNPSISKSQTLSPTQAEKTFYIRIKKPGNYCDNYSSFKLRFKQPKKSSILKDTIICKGTTIDLDAGDGFDPALNLGFSSYKWYKESDPLQTSISNNRYGKNLPAGNYIVELGFNGCVYKQPVKISEPQDLVINNVLIEGNKVTILTANGIPPYFYSLDGSPYQSGNVFTVSKGDHIIEVKDACGSVVQKFSIIGIKNVITPNDDGINDFIDYSDLLTKIDPRFEVYDRNGHLIFKGMPENRFIWNGKFNGRPLPTASYWYILEWNESGNPTRVQNTGWILLKNRN
ncbi:gliding motility-associated C-terminal domain-containing protein [Epilithonimonas vandammei]|uniref:Gliding motility-associated C-terminal domain-containing protein n=1 Tax=Epilithonimonas vandammei TaxID=2487072 RepID=A0A3G8ZB50_9FLAO|nr:gliding motility-associated C-terminal domain-containing protein [Epilithonimonas vandammei]